MNSTSILLATTSLLLVVALILSFGSFKKNSSGDQASKMREKIRLEIEQLRLENQILRQSAPYLNPAVPGSAATPATPAIDSAQEVDAETKAQIEALQRELAEEQEAREKAEKEAQLREKETLHFMGEKTREAQREERKQNRVRIALKMGTVEVVNTEYGFVTFKPENEMMFQAGDELGIRRNSGILGRIVVARLEGNQYIANIKPNGFAGGLPAITEGDELIKLPDEYNQPIEE